MSVIKSTDVSVAPQEIFTSSATQGTDLGALAATGDGRYFRYALAGATTLVPGTLQQSPAQDTTNQNPSGGLAVSAAAIGANQVTLTGSLTLAANLLSGGWMSVNVTPGQGYTYKVKGNSAVSSATGCVVTLEDPLQVALTTSSKVIFTLSPYNGVIKTPATTLTGSVVGVAIYPIVNGQYGWIQVFGPCSLLGTGGTAVGSSLAAGSGTAGGVITAVAGASVVGYTLGTFVTGEYDFAFITIN